MPDYSEEQLAAIDRLVAEKVMGWHTETSAVPLCLPSTEPVTYWADSHGQPVVKPRSNKILRARNEDWQPTRDHEQALLILEKVAAPPMPESILTLHPTKAGWCCTIAPLNRSTHTYAYNAYAPTFMLAICLAALKTQGVDIENSGTQLSNDERSPT